MIYSHDHFDFLKHMQESIKKEKPKRILNIACGRELRPSSLENLEADFYGIDINNDVIGNNVRFCNVDTDKFPFDNSFFDVVICIFGIEHFKNPKNLFSEVNRVLRNGGKFIFVIPNTNNPLFFLNKLLPLRKLYFHLFLHRRESYKTYYKSNTISSIVKFARQNNFKIEEIITFDMLSVYSEDFGDFTKFIKKTIEKFEKIIYATHDKLRPRIYVSLKKINSA